MSAAIAKFLGTRRWALSIPATLGPCDRLTKLPRCPPSRLLAELLDEPDAQPVVQIDLTPEFQQNLKELVKRYRSIRADIQEIIQVLPPEFCLGYY